MDLLEPVAARFLSSGILRQLRFHCVQRPCLNVKMDSYPVTRADFSVLLLEWLLFDYVVTGAEKTEDIA
jgi:hypothetical protein